jgi:hypothetical protein
MGELAVDLFANDPEVGRGNPILIQSPVGSTPRLDVSG